jgi:iron complex transport system permease protein
MKQAARQPLTAARLTVSVAIAVLLALGAGIVSLAYGSSGFGGWTLVRDLVAGDLSDIQRAIVLEARLPRVVFAAVVGAALATTGAVFQAILRNPLAEPYILGVSGGAALGGTVLMSLTTLTGLVAGLAVPAAAFAGAMVAVVMIFAVEKAAPAQRLSNYVLLLAGVIFNAFASAVIMFLKSIVSAQKAQELLFYLMGTLDVEGTSWGTIASVSSITLVCLVVLYWYARDFNALSLGDEEAASLGVDVDKTRRVAVVISSLAVAVGVAFCGLIGFVGLVVPHGIRLLVGADHRVLIPCCAFGGAAFLALSDLLARSMFAVFSTTLPVGVVTAVIGAPLFVWFLWRGMKARSV